MTRRGLVLLPIAALACLSLGRAAAAQAITTEAAVTVGASTDEVGAAATQLRAFGETPFRMRYYVEAAWASASGTSDAFGAAYPYGKRLQPIEAYGEWYAAGGPVVAGIRAGRYRVPFGISSASDHAYTGFLRAPLIRYDGYYALSNNFLEHGVDVFAGVPRLTIEASVGRPADVGVAVRRPGADVIVRLQSTVKRAIIGASYIRTRPYQSPTYALGHTAFMGVDVRWMAGGLQLRGEWINGRPFAGTTTTGWYADGILHRRGMGPLTMVARVERLDYETPVSARALHVHRQTIGGRIRLHDRLSAQVNLLHHLGLPTQRRRVTADVGITYSVRR